MSHMETTITFPRTIDSTDYYTFDDFCVACADQWTDRPAIDASAADQMIRERDVLFYATVIGEAVEPSDYTAVEGLVDAMMAVNY